MSADARWELGDDTGSDVRGSPTAETADGAPTAGTRKQKSKPLYLRLLRLRHVHPNAWQRAALGEGAIALAVVLVLADVASAWTLLVLPVAVAVVVKAHDLLAGLLSEQPAPAADPGNDAPASEAWHDDGAAPTGDGAADAAERS